MRDLSVRERKEKSKLQREIEQLMQQVADAESLRKAAVLQAQNEAERVAHECRVAQEDRRITQQRMGEVQAEMEDMRRRADAKEANTEVFERELRKLQEQHRETLAQGHALKAAKELFEAQLHKATEQMHRAAQEYEMQQAQRIKEMADMQAQLAEVIAQNEKLKTERDKGSEKYRSKASQYKAKLKLALQNVQTLAQRIARYEIQLGPEHENAAGGHFRVGSEEMFDNQMIGDDEFQVEVKKLL